MLFGDGKISRNQLTSPFTRLGAAGTAAALLSAQTNPPRQIRRCLSPASALLRFRLAEGGERESETGLAVGAEQHWHIYSYIERESLETTGNVCAAGVLMI